MKSSISAVFQIIILLFGLSNIATAHEVRPSVADMNISDNTMTLQLRLSLEAFVADIDLSDLEDTDAAENASSYDRFRAMTAAELETVFNAYWPQMQEGITVTSGETPVQLELTGVEIPEVGDIDLPRDSTVSMRANLPETDDPIIVSWKPEYGDLVLRQDNGDKEGYTGFLSKGAKSDPIPRIGTVETSFIVTFTRAIKSGFDHIIPKGLDHILFVLGLFLLSLKLRPLLVQVTLFTLAHTITLALGMMGYISIPASVIEPLIAASIVYVAVENVISDKMSRLRPLIIFAFGLLHGLGFAFVFADAGLAGGYFITNLVGFNIGVEIGQLAVIGLAFLAVGLLFRDEPWYRSRITNPASIAIALVGAYWFVERVFL